MRCSNCGHKIKPDTSFCTKCGRKIDVNPETVDDKKGQSTTLFLLQHKRIIILVLIAICILIYFFCIRCSSSLCLLPKVINGDYCSLHTCAISNCTNKKALNSNYCYTHAPSTSSGLSYKPESAEDVLSFSSMNIEHNYSFTVCTAKITNNGRKTYSFVKVKGKFKDSSGNVINTDWTYAVGSEGLAPGETKSFRLSVDKSFSIKSCSLEIMDYTKE